MNEQSELKNKLIALGLRKEGKFVLRSKATSNAFWDIEKLADYPYAVTREIAKLFAEIIGQRPTFLVGIPKGGMVVGELLARHWKMYCFTARPPAYGGPERQKFWEELVVEAKKKDVLVVDDVLTTGSTIRDILHYSPFPISRIAVLINRSGLTELDSIPIISGVITDIVEVKDG